MTPPLVYGTLSDDARLSSVANIGPKSRTERPRKTKIGTELAGHVTRDSAGHHFQGQKVNLQGRGILWRPAQLLLCVMSTSVLCEQDLNSVSCE